tara:strand:- start:24 stop:239 length:216 start_codon:yes stop_codon:yes gene_type:complete
MKVRKFKTDEWVLYAPHIDSTCNILRAERKSAVILEVLQYEDFYDYRIFIDDGTSKIRKVKENIIFKTEQK